MWRAIDLAVLVVRHDLLVPLLKDLIARLAQRLLRVNCNTVRTNVQAIDIQTAPVEPGQVQRPLLPGAALVAQVTCDVPAIKGRVVGHLLTDTLKHLDAMIRVMYEQG